MTRPVDIPELERRDFAVELRVADDDEDRGPRIEGYAAVFDQLSDPIMGMFREKLEPGAFKRALRGKPDVVALWNHDANYPLGRSTARTLRMAEDDSGLKVEIEPPDTQWARDLLVSMRRGDVRQMSFAFSVAPKGEAWATDDTGMQIRTVSQVDRLYDVSVVTRPAYPQTSAAVRSLAGVDLDHLLAAVSRRDAAAMEDGDQELIEAAIRALGGTVPEPERQEPPTSADWAVRAAHRRRVLELLGLRIN